MPQPGLWRKKLLFRTSRASTPRQSRSKMR